MLNTLETQETNQMRYRKQSWTACTVIAAMSIATASGGHGKENLKVENRTEKKVLKFTTEYQFSRDLSPGRLIKAQPGSEGSVEKTYEVVTKDGKVVGKRLIDKKVTPAKNEIFHMSRSGYPTSRGSWSRSRVITMTATAYLPTDGSSQGLTASGIKARFGVVAVDPRVIKLGTMVYVEGYGFAIAADTGGAIKGNKIDLCMHSSSACRTFGRRPVKVHILQGR